MADSNALEEFELCEPAPIIWGENGRFSITDGKSVTIVFVTEEAMKATVWPPEASLDRLLLYADYYRHMAVAAISRGETWRGKIRIVEKDVLASPARYRTKRSTSHVFAGTQSDRARERVAASPVVPMGR